MKAELEKLRECHARLAESLAADSSRWLDRDIAVRFLISRGWRMLNPGTFVSPYDPSCQAHKAKALKIERRKDSKAHFAAVETLLQSLDCSAKTLIR